MRQNIGRPAQLEITKQTHNMIGAWLQLSQLRSDNFLFPSKVQDSPHLSSRQYARIVNDWVEEIDLDPISYGTHTIMHGPQRYPLLAKIIKHSYRK